MKRCFFVIFLILGTVIGSGFSTGKEIAVFFSRFGYYSFAFIPLAFCLFYFAFYFLMSKGKDRKWNEKSKYLNVIMLFCASIFSASMFAGIQNCGINFGHVGCFVLISIVLVFCFVACFKNLLFLSKTNVFLVPVLLLILISFFFIILPDCSLSINGGRDSLLGMFFCCLYVVLNISLSSVVIASCGEGLTKKQIRFASFVSAFILSAFIFVINFVILCNYDLIFSSMPLLSLSSGVMNVLLHFVIIVGCLTTLLSMVYISATSCERLGMKHFSKFFVSVVIPFVLSLIGFSSIVSILYPIASFFGIIVLFLLFGRA